MRLKETKSVIKQDEAEIKKKRFKNAYLEIYIVGHYNKLMDILIGKRKDYFRLFFFGKLCWSKYFLTCSLRRL